jgi:tripartite-type tricarboxylate transporter receptor subunit TctC
MSTKFMRRREFGATLACALASTIPGIAWAQKKPMRMVIPFPPGGGTDIAARLIGAKLAQTTGAPVVFENISGAGGTVGMAAAAKMPADGTAIVFGQVSNLVVAPLLMKGLSYDPLKSFTAIAHVADLPVLIACASSQPFKTLADVIQAAKADPKAITFGSAGNGTVPHLAGELLAQSAGIAMTHVAYRGSAAAMTDVLAGRVTLLITSLSLAVPYIESGRLRALGVSSGHRIASAPDIPTIAESANLPGFEETSWYGFFAPAGVPQETVQRLNADINMALDSPEVQAFVEKQEGAVIRRTTPDVLASLLRTDIEKWGQVIRQAKVTLD